MTDSYSFPFPPAQKLVVVVVEDSALKTVVIDDRTVVQGHSRDCELYCAVLQCVYDAMDEWFDWEYEETTSLSNWTRKWIRK
jgi:hypothetical protein